jgi:ribonuclease G
MDILIEDLEGSLWAVALDKSNKIQGMEIDPFAEIIRWGSVYMGLVARIDKAQNAAYIDLGYGFQGILYRKDVRVNGETPDKGKSIGQILRPGQMIMIQVKSPHNPAGLETEDGVPYESGKVSRLSMDIALAGRYMIYTPFSSENRVSKRIEDKPLRKALKSMLNDIDDINGCILRSSAANCQTDILKREGKILKAIWESLLEYDGEQEPTLLMLGPNAMQRMLSDLSDRPIDAIAVATEDILEETEEWCDLFAPDLMTKIELRTADNTRSGMGLFEIHYLIGQFEGLFQPAVILASGGVLIIEETAAMTVIDVNSAASKSKLQTNLDAAEEIARQLRVRNIGGIVMADFITMKTKKDQNRILDALNASFAKDICTVKCHGITELGVFEISRQRRTPTLQEKIIMVENGADLD